MQPSPSVNCPNCTMDPWKQRMFRIATDCKFHDVSFIVGTGKKEKKIGCNRTLLSIHCPVFEAMFESQMLESSEKCVRIPDISPIVFVSMITWMATNGLNITSICNLDDLIKLADKYQINGLLNSCSLFLKYNTITIHIVIDSILCQYHGVDLGLQNLKEMSIKLRILSYSTINDIINAISKKLNWNNDHQEIQLWRISNRKNGTTRPNRYLSPIIDDDHINNNNKKKKKKKNNKKKQEYDDGEEEEEEEEEEEDEDEEEEEEEDNNDATMDDDDDDEEDEEDDDEEEEEEELFNITNMKCSNCYKQNYNKKRNKNNINNNNNNNNNKWNQYSGNNPTKAIYARYISTKKKKIKKKNSELINGILNIKHYENKILLFLKYYDVYHEYLSIVGSILVDKNGLISSICKIIRDIAHWSDEHEILLFEEEDYNSNKINIINIHQTINESSLVDGDIIVFQEKSNIFKNLQLKNAKQYLSKYNYNNYNNNNNNNNNHHHHRGGMNSNRMRMRPSSSSTNNNNNNNNNNQRMNVVTLDIDDQYIV